MKAAAIGVLLLVAAGGCAKRDNTDLNPASAQAQAVRVDGSSTVYLISKAVGEEVAKGGTRVEVNESGTTGGFKKFCRGETDVSGASRPIDQKEIDECKQAGILFIELPIGYDGLAVVVNDKNDWVDHLTVEELRRMWAPDAAGAITSWKQIREGFPDRPLHLVGPGGDSGTFDYFTQAIVGKQGASRTDYKSSEDDMVLVHGVLDDENALGYFGFAYYVRNQSRLKLLPIDDGSSNNGDGPIAPSPTTVANGSYQPLSRPLFIYVNEASVKRPEVDAFVSFYLKVVRELSAEVGYVSLSQRSDQLAKDRYKSGRLGSMFAGSALKAGRTMESLLEAQSQ